jgi:hypothetical protein
VLKDVPSISLQMLCSPEKDAARLQLFPNLDYHELFSALVQLLEILPQIQLQSAIQSKYQHKKRHFDTKLTFFRYLHKPGTAPSRTKTVVAQNLLHTFTCLIPFLAHEDMDQLPYLLANSIAVIPPNLHKDLLDILCYNLLPFTVRNSPHRTAANGTGNHNGIDDWHLENYANVSIPTILMMVFFYTDPPAYNTQLFETLMQLKRNPFPLSTLIRFQFNLELIISRLLRPLCNGSR